MNEDLVELRRLQGENAQLRLRIELLESEVRYLRTHPTIAQGIKGETLVCKLTGGAMTEYAAAHDVTLENEITIEVKFSKANSPSKVASTRRWNWSKLLGWRDKGKHYDFLLLIGEKDPRFLQQYLEDDAPYVFFLIPASHVQSVLSKGEMIGSQAQLITNLAKAKSDASRAIKRHMVPSTLIASVIEQTDHMS